jgi:hypothetical protein
VGPAVPAVRRDGRLGGDAAPERQRHVSAWRAFSGLWLDDGFAWTDETGLTWGQARDVLREELRQGYTGSLCCADCREQFTAALAYLDAAAPGQPVWLTADGHDYLVIRDDTPVPRMEDDRDGLLIVRSQA